MLGAVRPEAARAQWTAPARPAYLAGSFNWEFRNRFPEADHTLQALSYVQGVALEQLWREAPPAANARDESNFEELARIALQSPPRFAVPGELAAPAFAKAVPEVQAMLSWAWVTRRQLLDVVADRGLDPASRAARITELLAYYREQPALAVSTLPKADAAMDSQFYSHAFRRAFPRVDALWSSARWLELETLETLVTVDAADSIALRLRAARARFAGLLANGRDSSLPLTPRAHDVAPRFAERHPGAAALLDNLGMLESAIADVLTSAEVPRSARRLELLRLAARFRDDTLDVAPFAAWSAADAAPVAPDTGHRPATHAGMAHGATDSTPHAMPPMAADSSHGSMDMQAMTAMHRRMLADPVIRERIATDPVLQRMMSDMGGMSRMGGMDGMTPMDASGHAAAMGTMPGMTPMDAPTTATRRRAAEFIVRLLADPTVESRINGDPRLAQLRDDPEVQHGLEALRRVRGAAAPSGATPRRTPVPAAPSTPPTHQHPVP